MNLKILFGQLILTILLSSKEATGAQSIGKCNDGTQPGSQSEECYLECNLSEGTCSETLKTEKCSCTQEGYFTSETYNYENGILTSAVGKRRRRQAEDSVCSKLATRCKDCKKGGEDQGVITDTAVQGSAVPCEAPVQTATEEEEDYGLALLFGDE